MELKIKEAADAAGVSVRTLHHYDQIGLLSPEKTAENGYRCYSASDLERLQQIMFFRELDFSLTEIKSIINNPDFDRKHAFKSHQMLLLKKRKRLDSILKTLEQTIMSMEEKKTMSSKKRFEAFDMSEIEEHKKKYADEVKEKYGTTDAYRESSIKTENYTAEDWKRITENGNLILKKLADLMDTGASSQEALAAAERWRQHITESYYDCSLEILKGLGEMYTSDERFKKNIDKIKPGLAVFLGEVIQNYCTQVNIQ